MKNVTEARAEHCVGGCAVHKRLSLLLYKISALESQIEISEAMLAVAKDDRMPSDIITAFLHVKSTHELESLVPRMNLVLYDVRSVEDLFVRIVECQKKLKHMSHDLVVGGT